VWLKWVYVVALAMIALMVHHMEGCLEGALKLKTPEKLNLTNMCV
jgi:hypothetical protein